MQHILVNALSATHQSGTHVLLGHLVGLMEPLADQCRFIVLCRSGMTALHKQLGSRVDWVHAPDHTRHWLYRTAWERRNLTRLADRTNARLYYTPSGIAASALHVPQVIFCQNPWALVPAARRPRDAPKAWLQRCAYRQAMRQADVMVFDSRYMQAAYRRNAGFREKQGLIVYQAADDETRKRAKNTEKTERNPGQIFCVSGMARHKNVETVIQALHRLRANAHPEATLVVAGGWPDCAYEKRIRRLTQQLHLHEHVRFPGFVSREELDRLYAQSQIFCLMSKCESFGIPAIEAQLFGTPVVSSNVCAIPEICGAGGRYRDPGDVTGVAEALGELLENPGLWKQVSRQARENARRFAWKTVTRPLQEVFIKVLKC